MAALIKRDQEALAARWITPGLAEQADIRRVSSVEGAQRIGRNGTGN